MLRVLTVAAMVTAAGSAAGLYIYKHDTRQIEARVLALERLIDSAEQDIAALKAERASLLRPERIDRIARERLGLRPIEPSQLGAIEALAARGINGAAPPVSAPGPASADPPQPGSRSGQR